MNRTVINPATGRSIRVGGRVFNTLLRAAPAPAYPLYPPRLGGGLMIDRELYGASRHHLQSWQPTPPVSLRQKRIVKKSMLSDNETVFKGAKRSLKGKYRSRPSPPLSATLFTTGSRERGNDGHMWTISQGRRGIKRWTRE